jgi:hypothetical protein
VDVLTLETETPGWAELRGPSANADIPTGDNFDYYDDGRPSSKHGYYGVTFDEWNNRIMFFSGSRWQAGGQSDKIDSFDLDSNDYNAAGTHPDLDSGFIAIMATAKDPFNGDVYVNQTFAIGRWNREANTFETLSASGSPSHGYKTAAAYDATRGRILHVGGANDDNTTFDPSTNTWTNASITGAEAAVFTSGYEQYPLVYIPALDAYLGMEGNNGTVYQLTAGTFVATEYPTNNPGSVPDEGGGNGVFNRFLFLPRLGGIFYYPDYDSNGWFLKLFDAAGEAGEHPPKLTLGFV